MDKRNFSRVTDKRHNAGFYVNVIFESEPHGDRAVEAPLRNERRSVPRDVHESWLYPRRWRNQTSTLNPTEDVWPASTKSFWSGTSRATRSCATLPKAWPSPRSVLRSIATGRNEAGETKEEVTFVDVDAFGKQAETLGQYMKKGSPLLVEGRLRLDQWDDKQTGQKRSKLGVVVEGFQFLGGGNRGEAGSEPQRRPAAAPSAAPAAAPATPAAEPDMPPPEEDDVPF